MLGTELLGGNESMSRDETESDSTATLKTSTAALKSDLPGPPHQPVRIADASADDYLPTDLAGRWLLRLFTGIEILRSWITKGAPAARTGQLE